ncbi:hypothetical protein JW835_07295, partial [bacterium]|nr:hypothetical protein [bacterium]
MQNTIFGKVVLFCSIVLFSGMLYATVTVDEIVIVPKVVLDSTGYVGDLVVDPTNGTLHCIWPNKYGILKYNSRSIDGVWGDNEIIPTLGLPVTAEDGQGFLRNSCGLTVDEHGVLHIVYGVKDGDLYYVTGNSHHWSDPYVVVKKSRPSCFPEIEVIDDNLTIIWEDASRTHIKEVFLVARFQGQWTSPKRILMADNPDLISSDNGILYLSGRLFNNNWPDYDTYHNALLSYSIPGFLDWQTTQVTHVTSGRVGKAPRMAVYQNKIAMAWNTTNSWAEIGGDYDKKGELRCALAFEPGLEWEEYLDSPYPIFTVATSDPYGVVAFYSDGTLFLANGKAGELAVNSTRFFSINPGGDWSKLRLAEWEDGMAHLASDGKTVWALGGPTGYDNREVSVSGYTNPYAERFDFDDHAPTFTSFPDTVTLSHSLWRSSCHATDPDGDPVRYSLAYGPKECLIDSIDGSLQWQVSDIDTHIIGVKASDNRGKCDVHYFRLHVIDHIYHINFSVDQQQGTAPFTVQFTNLSQGPIEQVH